MTKGDAVDRHFVGSEFQHRRGFTICYRSSVFMPLKMFQYDIHIFSWHQRKLSLGNLQLLRHRIAEDL